MKKIRAKKEVKGRVQRTLKAEIQAVSQLSKILERGFFSAVDILSARKGRILVTGVGKSGFIAMKMASTLTSLGHSASYLNPLDALHGDSGIVHKGDVLIIFSASGASSELVRLIKHFRAHFKIKTISVTANAGSELGKLSDAEIVFDVSDEGCPIGLAPMASTTASLVIGDLIASALTSPELFKPEHFAKYHPAGTLGLSLRKVSEVMRTGHKLPKVVSDASFRAVLQAITKHRNSQVTGVIGKNNRLVGIIADGDIRRLLIEQGDLRGAKAKDIMNPKPKVIRSADTLQKALSIMGENRVTGLFVIDGSRRYIGFIHMHDILGS